MYIHINEIKVKFELHLINLIWFLLQLLEKYQHFTFKLSSSNPIGIKFSLINLFSIRNMYYTFHNEAKSILKTHLNSYTKPKISRRIS